MLRGAWRPHGLAERSEDESQGRGPNGQVSAANQEWEVVPNKHPVQLSAESPGTAQQLPDQTRLSGMAMCERPASIDLVQWSRGFAFGSIGRCCSSGRGVWCCVVRVRGGRPQIVPQYITDTAMLSDEGLTILLRVGPCRSQRQTTVVESQTEVQVGVTALLHPGRPELACLDHVRIELASVLGSRSLVDSRNGRVVEVEPAR